MRVVAMILAGGEGSRLTVLSAHRAKPSVPFAGKYRIIDFTISNCVNSEIYDIAVLTQYRPHSLNEHIGIGKPWDLDRIQGGIRLLQPYQAREGRSWYAGTADAVFQNLDFIENRDADGVLILSGDHIYKMDYREMIRFHQEKGADATVAVMNVPREEAHRFGILTTNRNGRITAFYEKPKDPPGTLASMGIYLFNTDVLEARLKELHPQHPDLDFGKHVLPSMIERHDRDKVYAFPFEGYWVDVGTIEAYWKTSMELCEPTHPLDLWDTAWQIRTRSQERPPVKTSVLGKSQRALISNGCIIQGEVYRSVLSPGVFVSPGAVVRESVVMNDTFIGPGAVLDKVVVDKNVVVGAGVRLGVGDDLSVPNAEMPDKIHTGITVVGKGAFIPENIVIGRNVLIDAGVDVGDFENHTEIPSGASVHPGGVILPEATPDAFTEAHEALGLDVAANDVKRET